jgi:hypothetical protein
MYVNDVWVNTADANKTYRWNGSSWAQFSDTRIVDALTNAAGAQATADGKIKTYIATSAPTGGTYAVGDLWYNPNTKNVFRWNGSSWADNVASLGAIAGTNLLDSSLVTLGDSAVKNSAISISSSGVLSGAGGGAVTINGLGYVGELYAGIGDNYIRNSLMSANATGWTFDGSFMSRVAGTNTDIIPAYIHYTNTSAVNEGAYANGMTSQTAPVANMIPVQGGRTMYVSMLVRTDAARRVRLFFRGQLADGTFPAGTTLIDTSANTSSVWTLFVSPTPS